jgi:EmrB/QacA subfamily drug resistance transporter
MFCDTDAFRIDSFPRGSGLGTYGHNAGIGARHTCDLKDIMASRSASPRTAIAGPEDRIRRRRWLILGVLITSLMAIVLDNTVLNVALKTIAEPGVGLGASQSQLEWGINSYTLVFAGLLFTFGVLGDRIGRKRMLMIGLVAFGFFSLVTAYAQTPDQLIWARAAMGLAAAAVMPQTLSIITNVFDPAERPRAIGIWAMAVGIGVAIGPVVGGLLLAHFWWGSVFLLNVPFTAAGAAAVWLVVPESKNPDPGTIDFVGVLASIAGLVLLVYGIIQGGEKGSWVHTDVLGPIVAGLAVLAFFAWYESRLRYPSLDVRLFRNPRLSSAIGALALVFFGMMGALFFLSFYLQSVRGYTPLQAGLLSLPFAAGQVLMAPRSAGLARRFGTKAVVASGLLVVAVALAGYQTLGMTTPIWVLGGLFLLQGAGMGTVMPPATEAVMSVVPRERAGSGSALTNTARQVAAALGVAVLGSILAQAYRAQLGPHLTALPAQARGAATGSITATQAVAAKLGAGSPAGRDLAAFADTAFVHAMHITTLISAAITLLGVLVVLIWMPGRAGRPVQASVAEPAAGAAEVASHAEPVPALAPAQVAAVVPNGQAAATVPDGPVSLAGAVTSAGAAGAAGAYAAAPAEAEG